MIAIILLAAGEDDEMLMLAIKAGAASYLTKAATNKQLIEHIRRVSQAIPVPFVA
jgi:FixJ family two-component response regulator